MTARGKREPRGPAGSRQGLNDYTLWFAGDADMDGNYFGYDGPCPPWNDALLHHYHFTLYAIDLARCPVDGEFTGQQVKDAIAQHVLAEARLTGTYCAESGREVSAALSARRARPAVRRRTPASHPAGSRRRRRVAVGEVGRNHQSPLAADAHPGDALVPAGNHLAAARARS